MSRGHDLLRAHFGSAERPLKLNRLGTFGPKKESEHYQPGASQAQARISASMAETHKEDEKESFIGSKKALLSTKIALLLDVKTALISSG